MKGREDRPGIMVVMEPVTVKGAENYIVEESLMHVRSRQWYRDTFKDLGFGVVDEGLFNRSKDEYNDEVIFCLKPDFLGTTATIE